MIIMRVWHILLIALAVTLTAGCVQPGIKDVQAHWGEVNDQYSELVANVDINNPLPFLPLKDVESYVYINGIQIAHGNAIDIEKDRVVLSIKIENQRIKDMWVSHLQHGENSEMMIKIVPVINLLVFDYRYPIEVSQQLTTNMLGMGFEDQVVSVGGVDIFAFRDIRLELGKVDNLRTELVVSGTAENNAPVSIDISKIEYSIEMNGITMGKGVEEINLNLKPGEKEKVRVPIYLDNTKLPEWWVTHVKNGEKTTVKVNAKIYVSFMGAEYPIQISQETQFETAIASSVKI